MERVQLGTETVTEQQQVDETVRKEVIETEGTEGLQSGRQPADPAQRDRKDR